MFHEYQRVTVRYRTRLESPLPLRRICTYCWLSPLINIGPVLVLVLRTPGCPNEKMITAQASDPFFFINESQFVRMRLESRLLPRRMCTCCLFADPGSSASSGPWRLLWNAAVTYTYRLLSHAIIVISYRVWNFRENRRQSHCLKNSYFTK